MNLCSSDCVAVHLTPQRSLNRPQRRQLTLDMIWRAASSLTEDKTLTPTWVDLPLHSHRAILLINLAHQILTSNNPCNINLVHTLVLPRCNGWQMEGMLHDITYRRNGTYLTGGILAIPFHCSFILCTMRCYTLSCTVDLLSDLLAILLTWTGCDEKSQLKAVHLRTMPRPHARNGKVGLYYSTAVSGRG